jgi:RNA polymerase sigma-70 factor, ECF subfamily
VEADDVQAEQQAFEELRIRAMELARQSCTENSWLMFWQTVVEGRPTADVAMDFGVSAAAVRMARGRVLNLLREFLVDDVTMPGRLDPA